MPGSELERVNALLEQINPLIFGEGSKLRLCYVDFGQVREQDINANVMPAGMFNALVANIRKNRALESIPLCATRIETPDVIEIVSGHHRIRAGKEAGIRGGVVLLYEGLTNSEIRAKQLSHNSISGTSDPEIVRQIFAQIDDLADRMESYIDPTAFDELPKAVKFDMVDVDPLADARSVMVLFLPTQARDFATAMELLHAKPDQVYLGARDAFEGFKGAVQKVREELEIVAMPTALAQMARLAVERLAQIREERERIAAEAAAANRDPVFPEVAIELDADLLEAFGGQ